MTFDGLKCDSNSAIHNTEHAAHFRGERALHWHGGSAALELPDGRRRGGDGREALSRAPIAPTKPPRDLRPVGKMSSDRIANILCASPLFAGSTPGRIQALAAKARVNSLDAGQNIFSTGDNSETLYVVLEGRIRIVRFSEDGQEIALGFIEPGEIFGEVAMIDGGRRSASAYVQEECKLGAVSRSDFFDFLNTEPQTSVRLLVMMCGRLRNTIDQVHNIGLMKIEARLARTLLWLASNYGVASADGVMVDIKIGHREIGAFVAATRESVGKQLRLWRDEGLIDREGGKFIIRDMEALSELAGDEPEG